MPAKAKVPIDRYANRAQVNVTASAANTLTFEQIRFGVGTFQGVGLILHRVEWHPSVAALQELNADTDYIYYALVTRDSLTSLVPSSLDVLIRVGLVGNVQGTAASLLVHDIPLITDWTDLPGGGLIIPANPLYLAIDEAGFGTASRVDVVLWYTFIQLSDKDYLELIQTLVPGNI